MKNQTFTLLVFAAVLLTLSGCYHEGNAYIPPLVGTVFVSSDEAWVLTRKGILKRILIDGQLVNTSDAQQRIQGMSFTSPAQGWTVDADWNVWHFNGVQWALVGHNDDNKFGLVRNSGLGFVDEKVGWARTLEPLFITDDGGITWQKVLVTEPGEFNRLSAIDRNTAFLYSDKGVIRRTTDRGQTWTDLPLGDSGDVTSFACRDNDARECWAGTADGEIFAIKGEASPKRVPFPTPKEMTITYIFPFGAYGLLVSGFTLVRDGNPRPYGVLLTSRDEGTTWKKVDVPQDDGFEQVSSFGTTIWLASHTAIYRSADSGGSWAKVYDANN